MENSLTMEWDYVTLMKIKMNGRLRNGITVLFLSKTKLTAHLFRNHNGGICFEFSTMEIGNFDITRESSQCTPTHRNVFLLWEIYKK